MDEKIKPDVELIITQTEEEFTKLFNQHKEDGWKLESDNQDYVRFKNEFPILMQTTPYMRTMRLPDFVEIYRPGYKPERGD